MLYSNILIGGLGAIGATTQNEKTKDNIIKAVLAILVLTFLSHSRA